MSGRPAGALPAQPRAHRVVNILLLGFGNVGRAFAKMVLRKKSELSEATDGLEIRVIGISTGSHGFAYDVGGVDLAACLALATADSSRDWQFASGEYGPQMDMSFTDEMLSRACEDTGLGMDLVIDAVLECITTPDHSTGEPALSYLMKATESLGCHIVTASKGPVLHGFRSLAKAAERQGKRFLFESSVMDGVPVFSFARAMMPGCAQILGFDGILNSTTNIVLTEMEATQCSYADALAKAQRDGIAEREPSLDIDGHDAAIKVAILATVLLGGGEPITLAEVDISAAGIGAVTLDDINAAARRGARLKVVCSGRKVRDRRRTTVVRTTVAFRANPAHNLTRPPLPIWP